MKASIFVKKKRTVLITKRFLSYRDLITSE